MPQVPVVKIVWDSQAAFVRDVVAALQQIGLSRLSAEILTAHISLSTGWGKAADNYRLAGIKATSEAQPYTIVEGFEYKNGVRQPKTPMKWRAFETLQEGAKAVVDLLRNSTRYAEAYKLLLTGSTEYFAAVGRAGWYTAPIESTAASMLSRLQTIRRIMNEPPVQAAVGGGLLLLLVGGWLFWRWMKR